MAAGRQAADLFLLSYIGMSMKKGEKLMYKKWLSFKGAAAALLACSLMLFVQLPAVAAEEGLPAIKVLVDQEELVFDVPPELVEGNTLVPFRNIFEKFGLTVGWDQETQTVTGTKENFVIKLRIGETTADLNGRTVELAAAPQIMHEKTFVPLRFVGEATGRDVGWNGDQGIIFIESNFASSLFEVLYSSALEYKGPVENGVPHGKGQYWYKGKLWYEGNFVHGVMEGSGKWIDPANEKSFYEGEFHNNLMEGTGKLVYDSGDYYVGSFVKAKREGQGKTFYANGQVQYDGRFHNDRRNGEGTYWVTSDYSINGTFIAGQMHGEGKIYSKGSLIFEGQFKGFKRDGLGKEYSSEGKLSYEGNYDSDKYQGDGKLYYSDGALWYEGYFRSGAPDGQGSYYGKDGALQYKGAVSHYEMIGHGTIYLEGGSYYTGEVYRGKPDGMGALYDKSGSILKEGFFFQGAYQSDPEVLKQTDKYREHLLEKRTQYFVIDGLDVNNMNLTSKQAIVYLYIQEQADLDTFKGLSDTKKRAFFNEYIQSRWGEVLGVEQCFIFMQYKNITYAAVSTGYEMPDSQIRMEYYPDGQK
jgi:internalin A